MGADMPRPAVVYGRTRDRTGRLAPYAPCPRQPGTGKWPPADMGCGRTDGWASATRSVIRMRRGPGAHTPSTVPHRRDLRPCCGRAARDRGPSLKGPPAQVDLVRLRIMSRSMEKDLAPRCAAPGAGTGGPPPPAARRSRSRRKVPADGRAVVEARPVTRPGRVQSFPGGRLAVPHPVHRRRTAQPSPTRPAAVRARPAADLRRTA